MWRVIERRLSDGSAVYDVTNGTIGLPCIDEDAAFRLLEAIEKYTVETTELALVGAKARESD